MPANKRILILTVGLGGRSPEPLLKALGRSVRQVNPDLLGLVYSTETEDNKNSLIDGFDGESVSCRITDPNNVDRTFAEIIEFMDQLSAQTQTPLSHFQIDFTSGTKSMSAAAVLAGVVSGVDQLNYVAGQRNEDGVVQSGLEVLYNLQPTQCLAYLNLQEAIRNLADLRYRATRDLLDRIPEKVLPPQIRRRASDLKLLSRAYEAWDLFNHREAFRLFKEVGEIDPGLEEFAFPKERWGLLNRLVRCFPEQAHERPTLAGIMLADLYCNAVRRMREGKYDDACARLYRLTEMCAQLALQEHGIDTGRVRESQVPEEHRDQFDFSPHGDGVEPEAKLGMHKAFELLRILEDPVGDLLQPNSDFSNLLSKRNQSILAHGFDPVERETCEQLADRIRSTVSDHICSDFESLCRRIQFPWLDNGKTDRDGEANPFTDAEGYAQRVMGYKTGEVVSQMIHLGDKLGLYRVLRGGTSRTAEEIAKTTGLHPRWVLEWLRNQAAAGLVLYDQGRFRLSSAGEAVFLDDSHPFHMAGFFAVPSSREDMERVVESFRTGLGRNWDDFGPEVACMVKRVSSPAHQRLPDVLRTVNGLPERLREGIRVADVGCGCGFSTLTLARLFPNSRFEGFDPSPIAIETAAKDAERAGISNIRFRLSPGEDLPREPTYDLVLTLDCMHDLSHPAKVAGAIRRALHPDGIWLIKDVRCSPRFEENLLNPFAPLLYGISVLYCMASALSVPEGAGLGTMGFNPELAERMSRDAGFTRFRVMAEIEDPINVFYEVRP